MPANTAADTGNGCTWTVKLGGCSNHGRCQAARVSLTMPWSCSVSAATSGRQRAKRHSSLSPHLEQLHDHFVGGADHLRGRLETALYQDKAAELSGKVDVGGSL